MVKNLPEMREIKVQSPGAFQVVLVVKNPLTNAGDIKDCLFDPWGWEDPLGKGTATHSSILALRISGTEEPAAAAKSLQSCPTLCDPIDNSPPGSPIPGILHARTVEWVAISFSDA